MGYMILRDGKHGIHFYPPGKGEFVNLAGGVPALWDSDEAVLAQVSTLIELSIICNLELDLTETEPPTGKFYLFGRHVQIVGYIPQLDSVILLPVK